MRTLALSVALFLGASIALRYEAPKADPFQDRLVRPVLAAETHPFSVQDMVGMDRISDPQCSPDGKWISFVLRTTDLDANRGRTDLWLIGSDGVGLRRLTSHPADDSNPCWSPDSRSIWFLSSRAGSSQVWQISVDGGEAVQVTKLPLDVNNLSLSPDGTRIAFSLEVFPDAKTIEATKDRLDAEARRKSTGRIYDQLFIRHWDTWTDGRRNHIFTMPAGGGTPVDIMQGMDADSPSKPFGGTEEFSFTPDGQSIVFTARDAGRAEAWSTNFDLFLTGVDGRGSRRNLTGENPAWDTTPVFSPDGKTMAYLAMARAGFEADRFRILLLSSEGGRPRILTEKWDRSPDSLAWSSDGRTIYATAENLGQKSLFAIDVETGNPRTVVLDGTVNSPRVAVSNADARGGSERIVYGLDTLTSPVELFSVRPDGRDVRQLTNVNREKVAAARMGEAEQFTFKGAQDETIYAYVVRPVDFDPAKRYPVAFLIHGGPQGSFGNHFHYRWNPQAYAGAGYAAVMVDFHGSTGYGQRFTDSISNDWGGKPFVDLQKGLAAALGRYPWMDGNRVAALGASYGAYMINWIAGNWPDRFRCLVSHDGNLDERFAYYGTEELWFPEWEHGGTPWDNPAGYEKHNPQSMVKNWKTPMLVIHGGQDFRIVDSEGIAVFTALQRRGVPSKFLYFPDENHWVLKPANSIQWHETVIDWLNRWTK
ncbi:MAG: S9 family peptidase [Acidobacteria bacterium]|nr:S9 family peptidase [Acidobacteriota bacterium]